MRTASSTPAARSCTGQGGRARVRLRVRDGHGGTAVRDMRRPRGQRGLGYASVIGHSGLGDAWATGARPNSQGAAVAKGVPSVSHGARACSQGARGAAECGH
eukprot:7025123-Prymnesium_polylepis.1